MPTIFTKIINGEIPCYKIAEDDNYLAFLDISPLAIGHTLVIPKKEVDYIFDIEDKMLADMHVFSKKVARAIERVIPCKRIGVAVIGLEVPHAHIHLIPLNTMNDINFSRPKMVVPKDKLEETAQLISVQVVL
ncbi:MAG TPA: HIT family protein [Cytophagaceae bacterium]|jgi:histidine triad (HIT) family protein|nr:HIT family protein [Cytophagaceae bacterium]